MIILLHTSKTMKPQAGLPVTQPSLLSKARELAGYVQHLSVDELAKVMKISLPLAKEVHATFARWNDDSSAATPAALAFVGDIYSGLQAATWSDTDWHFAQQHLYILSGLYGVLRPQDGVRPYRLEMGYRLPDQPYRSLYEFWGSDVADTLPQTDTIINLAAVEYSRVVLPYLQTTVITPRFLTYDAKTREPKFIVVHAKIARGAFANWLITHKVNNTSALTTFQDLGYAYDAQRSTPLEPVFVCHEFGGKGLSVRLS